MVTGALARHLYPDQWFEKEKDCTMLLMIFCLLGFGSRFAVVNPPMIDLHYLSLSLTLPHSPTLSIIPMVEAISWKGKDP